MKLLVIAAAFLGLAMLARESEGAERAAKPVVCVNYRVIEAGTAICSDTKRPFLVRNFVVAVVPGQDSAAVKVLVGWR